MEPIRIWSPWLIAALFAGCSLYMESYKLRYQYLGVVDGYSTWGIPGEILYQDHPQYGHIHRTIVRREGGEVNTTTTAQFGAWKKIVASAATGPETALLMQGR